MLIAGGIVEVLTVAGQLVVAAAVAGADVEVAVLPEMQVGTDVEALGGRDVVDQDLFAGRIHRVVVAQHEARDAVDRAERIAVGTGAVLLPCVVEVDLAVGGERGVGDNRHHAPLGVGADLRRDVECRSGQRRAVLDDAQAAGLLCDQHPSIGREGEARRPVRAGHELIGKAGGQARCGRGRSGGCQKGQNESGRRDETRPKRCEPHAGQNRRDSWGTGPSGSTAAGRQSLRPGVMRLGVWSRRPGFDSCSAARGTAAVHKRGAGSHRSPFLLVMHKFASRARKHRPRDRESRPRCRNAAGRG